MYWFQYVKLYNNPIGVDLYEKQVKYLERIKKPKGSKRDPNKPGQIKPEEKPMEKPKEKPVEKPVAKILRHADPEINLQKLMST